MCDHNRRHFVARLGLGGLLLTPLAAALSGCKQGNWPDGMAEIKWDRNTCARCNMVISDRRFAAQLRGGPDDTAFVFDDIGCLVFWLRDKAGQFPWINDAATRLWVADVGSKSRDDMQWLDPRRAHFVSKSSPMGYNFGAVAMPQPGSLDFNEMREHTLAKGR
jgi:hypothetical protein